MLVKGAPDLGAEVLWSRIPPVVLTLKASVAMTTALSYHVRCPFCCVVSKASTRGTANHSSLPLWNWWRTLLQVLFLSIIKFLHCFWCAVFVLKFRFTVSTVMKNRSWTWHVRYAHFLLTHRSLIMDVDGLVQNCSNSSVLALELVTAVLL